MRGSREQGRFRIDLERRSIAAGIDYDLQRQVGQSIEWWKFDPENTDVDPVYDVGDSDGGRRYTGPIVIPTINAVILQGEPRQTERGFYNTDVLRAFINITEVDKSLQDSISEALNDYLLDRIVYRDQVFIPTRVYPRGLIEDKYTIFSLDAEQVNPEQLVNDPQFLQYAEPGVSATETEEED